MQFLLNEVFYQYYWHSRRWLNCTNLIIIFAGVNLFPEEGRYDSSYASKGLPERSLQVLNSGKMKFVKLAVVWFLFSDLCLYKWSNCINKECLFQTHVHQLRDALQLILITLPRILLEKIPGIVILSLVTYKEGSVQIRLWRLLI